MLISAGAIPSVSEGVAGPQEAKRRMKEQRRKHGFTPPMNIFFPAPLTKNDA
jgi:hypothetical protein